MTNPWDLLRAWKAGDEAAAEALIEVLYPTLSRFFRNKVAVPGDVVDLVNQTLLAIVEARDRVDASRPFRPYLFGVARNCLFTHLRKRAKQKREAVDFEATCVRDLPSASPSSIVMRRREANALVIGLRSVPIADQVILELKFFEGLKDREIAEVVGCSRGTVHGRMSQGLQRLRVCVQAALDAGSGAEPVDIELIEAWAASVRSEIGERPGDEHDDVSN